MTFIHKLIEQITNSNVDYVDTLIVLPNRRAHRKLVDELIKLHTGKTFFSPTIYPMDEFVSNLSSLRVIDSSTQLLRLLKVVRKYNNNYCNQKGFQIWARSFLHDISDMDMQLQDVVNCLREYAVAAKFEIPFGKDEILEFEQQKILFNELLSQIYTDFKALLKENSETYTGLLYRDCAENISEYSRKIDHKRIVFAGFYALSPAELQIINHFKDHFNTEVYFDIDPFYCHLEDDVNNDIHRQTSFFVKRNCERLGLDLSNISFISNDYAETEKALKIVATSKNVRQVYCAIEEIEKIKAQKLKEKPQNDKLIDMSDTVVVLADEQLVVPFVSAYNVDNVDVNITMGLPISLTPIYSVLQMIISIYEMAAMLTDENRTELIFNGAQIQNFFCNKYVASKFPTEMNIFPNILTFSQMPKNDFFTINQKNQIGINLNKILINACKVLKTCDLENNEELACDVVIEKLQGLQLEIDKLFTQTDVMELSLAKLLVTNCLNRVSLVIKGDPEKSLQVMGLLETRMLDFKNVIVVSVNEGILPSGLKYDSLLPFDFKYKLDGKEAISNYLYQDQVYAYHFFRLLQRAENVTLIYNNTSEGSLAECSRFVKQLEYEVKRQNLEDTIHIEHIFKDFSLTLPKPKSFQVEKTDEIIDILKKLSYSASSLKTFILCPMKFYFQQVAKIKKTNFLSDELESYETGNVIHGVYQEVFDEIKSNPDNYSQIIDKYLDNLDEEVKKQIRKLKNREDIADSSFKQGSWLVNLFILKENIKNYLQVAKEEFKNARIEIIGNELHKECEFRFTKFVDEDETSSEETEQFDIKLNGTLDRVQDRAGIIEILDYKSGTVDAKHLKVTAKSNDLTPEEQNVISKQRIFEDPNYEKLFQLMFYTLLYSENKTKRDNKRIYGGIISTRAINKEAEDYILYCDIFKEFDLSTKLDFFKEGLNALFNEIFDKSKPFLQTRDGERCKYCDYADFCNKSLFEE